MKAQRSIEKYAHLTVWLTTIMMVLIIAVREHCDLSFTSIMLSLDVLLVSCICWSSHKTFTKESIFRLRKYVFFIPQYLLALFAMGLAIHFVLVDPDIEQPLLFGLPLVIMWFFISFIIPGHILLIIIEILRRRGILKNKQT